MSRPPLASQRDSHLNIRAQSETQFMHKQHAIVTKNKRKDLSTTFSELDSTSQLQLMYSVLAEADALLRSENAKDALSRAQDFIAMWPRGRVKEYVFGLLVVAQAQAKLNQVTDARDTFLETLKYMAKHPDIFHQDHEYREATANGLARAYLKLGQAKDALEWLDQLRHIHEITLGVAHPTTIDTYLLTAQAYDVSAQYQLAFDLYTRVQQWHERRNGNESVANAEALNAVGNTLLKLGRVTEAHQAYASCVDILNAQDDLPESDLANVHLNIATCLRQQNRLDDALAECNRSRVLCESAYGLEHVQTGTCLLQLGQLQLEKGLLTEAQGSLSVSLQVRQAAFGEKSVQTAETLVALGDLHAALGEHVDSARFFSRAHETLSQLCGASHESTIKCKLRMADANCLKGASEEALHIYLAVLESRRKALGKEHPEIAGLYNSIGNIMRQQDRIDDALEIYNAALEIYEKAYSPYDDTVATMCNNIGHLSRAQNAMQMYRRALAIRLRNLGADHPDVAACYSNIGFASVRLCSHRNALDAFVKAREIWERCSGEVGNYDDAVAVLSKQIAALRRFKPHGLSRNNASILNSSILESSLNLSVHKT